jgi:hypothetical protein
MIGKFNCKEISFSAFSIPSWYEKLRLRASLSDIKSPDFLGGNNVHHVLQLALLGFIAYKVYKK